MLRQSKLCRAAGLLAALGVLGGAGPAAAQSDGVVVDPESPAGKEYALPLDKARQDAAPAPGAGTTGEEETPLFGAGISKRNSAEDGGGDKGDGSDGGGQADGRGGGEDVGGAAERSVTAAASASGSGLSSGWLTALVAMGVLLVGGIVGLSLRALRTTERG